MRVSARAVRGRAFERIVGIMIASVVAEWARKGTLYPLDTMACRLQCARVRPPDEPSVELGRAARRRRALEDATAATVRHRPLVDDAAAMAAMLRRPRSLYRGLSASMIGAVPTSLVYMPTYEASSALLRALAATMPGLVPVAQLSSFVTGVASSLVRVPTSVIKARLQLGLSASIAQAFAAATQGGSALRGLYVGWCATCLLDVTYALVQFTSLEWLLGLLSKLHGGRAPTSRENVAVGFLTGVITATVTEPLDVIKTRLQTQKRAGGGAGLDFGYAGIVDGLRRAVAKEGVLALWRGLLPRLLLKAFGSAIWFATYSLVRGALVPPLLAETT